jgi:hypothetical protein
MPHDTLIKMADFQIEIVAWNLSMLNWLVTILLWDLVYSWMTQGVYFFSKADIDKEVNDVIFLYLV